MWTLAIKFKRTIQFKVYRQNIGNHLSLAINIYMYTCDNLLQIYKMKLWKKWREKHKQTKHTQKTISEHQIHKLANKYYYKTVICCNARSLTLWNSKINLDRLFNTLTFLDDMNETNLLNEGHDVCRYLLLMIEYFGQHNNAWYSVSTFELHNLHNRLSLSILVILFNSISNRCESSLKQVKHFLIMQL